MKSPKLPNHEILGAQHLSFTVNASEKYIFPVTQRRKLLPCGTGALLARSPETPPIPSVPGQAVSVPERAVSRSSPSTG